MKNPRHNKRVVATCLKVGATDLCCALAAGMEANAMASIKRVTEARSLMRVSPCRDQSRDLRVFYHR